MSPDSARPEDPEALRILVVEDDPALSHIVCVALGRTGCVVEAALSGTAALAALEARPADIVVLDYTLPDMRAEDLLDRVRQTESPPVVVAMTGHGTERIAADLLRRGARDYILKDERFHRRLADSVGSIADELRRRRAEQQELAQTEERAQRFHELYDEAPLPYQSLDSDGRIVAVNQAWLDLLGYERQEAIGRPILSFLDEESGRKFADAFRRFAESGRVDGEEAGFIRRSGERVIVRIYGRIVRDAGGAFLRTQCILQDITELRRAEQAAKEREQDYRRIVETAEEGVWVMDAAMRTTFVNARMCEILGSPEAQITKRDVADFMLPEDLPDHAARMQRRARGESERYVRRFVTADGKVKTLFVSATPIMAEDGSFQGSFAMLTDITELEARRQTIEQERQKTASILRAAPIGIGLVIGRVFAEVNDALCAMLGYAREELIGQSALMVYPTREEFERVGREKYPEIERTGKGSVETQFRRKDGQVIDVMLSSAVIDRADFSRGVTFTAADITRQKRSERALKDAVDRWQRTFDAVPDLICILDAEQRIVSVNKAMAERVKMAPEELQGRHCYEVVHRLGNPPEWCPYLKMNEHGTQSADMGEPNLGGTFNVTVTPIGDGDGGFAGAVHVVRDITDRIAAQREVQRSRDFLDCIINAVADPVFVKTAQHEWVLVNDAECQLTGRRREQMLGMTDRDFFPREQADAFWAADDEVLRTGETSVVLEDLTDASGVTRTLITSKARHVGPDGEEYIVGISKDVSELVETQHQLQRSRSRLESLFRLAHTTFESEQELMDYAVEEAVRLTGSEVGYAHFMEAGQIDLTLFAWSRKARELCAAPVNRKYSLDQAGVWADCARLGQPVIHNDYETLPDRKALPDGHIRIKRHLSVPVMDAGRVVMIAGVGNKVGEYDESDARDLQLYMTEAWHLLRRRQAEFDLRQMNAELHERVRARTSELQELVEELDAFAYSVSHDLTTPLRHVMQYAALMEEDHGALLDADSRRYLGKIRDGLARMHDRIDALLRLSRTSRSEVELSDENLSALALSQLEQLQESEPDRRVTCKVQPGLVGHCDRKLIEIVLQNLLGNAWKFTRRQPEATIEFGAIEEEGRRIYFVRDNGAGFDMAKAKRLFGAFQRFHDDESFPGHGIGLANVRRAVRRLGGRVWADSAAGQGATFYFTLGG